MNIQLGQMHGSSFASDPKHLGFVLRRYHFVARMLRGAKRVVEIGAGDGDGAKIVRAAVGELILTDKTPTSLDVLKFDPVVHAPLIIDCDAVYALDVLEHILPIDEDRALYNIGNMLKPNGTCIIGMPSLESQAYASAESVKYHVNCKTGADFLATMQRHFHNVFLLGLNDYALHDGFDQMVHYRLALCTGKK